jgi:hypothetical protein
MEHGDHERRGASVTEPHDRQSGPSPFTSELNTCVTREEEISTLLLPCLCRGSILAPAGKVGVLFIS